MTVTQSVTSNDDSIDEWEAAESEKSWLTPATLAAQRPAGAVINMMADCLHFRRWSPTSNSIQNNFGPVLKLVCYNVLAESLEENTTSALDPHISAFRWRKDRLVREMDAWNADIYCLQEVEHYTDFWEPYFNSRSANCLRAKRESQALTYLDYFQWMPRIVSEAQRR